MSEGTGQNYGTERVARLYAQIAICLVLYDRTP